MLKVKRSIISFKNIVKGFGKITVLHKLSLDVNQNEVLGLIGRSGCGKSTLLKVLIGAFKPDSGKLLYKGKDITGNSDEIRHLVGLTTQENSFYEKLTIYENMVYYSRLYGIKKDADKINSILKSVELFEKKKQLAGDISGGMKRRLDFAISLLHDPDLLILDEPTTGLDPILVKQFWNVVNKIKKKGKTIIVISHIFDELIDNCDRVAVMHKGTIKKTVQVRKGTNLSQMFDKEVN